jgi:hypothetical protein
LTASGPEKFERKEKFLETKYLAPENTHICEFHNK